MKNEWKQMVLAAVTSAAADGLAVRFNDVRAELRKGQEYLDNREIDRVLQELRREKAIRYLTKRDPKTGKQRKRWGWMLVEGGR